MLAALSIRDIVLIRSLNLTFETGLTALTGETGAGKSILLDALSLALGARGDADLVRAGCEKGQVTAVFDVPMKHEARNILNEQDIETDGDLILRRVQSSDGRSRAFVNDQPVSVNVLRAIGHLLVEIHGQHDERALVEEQAHRALIDAYADHAKLTEGTRSGWSRWQSLDKQLKAARASIERAREDEEYLRHVVEEIETLAPEQGEEAQLAEMRQTMMVAEKLAGELSEAMAVVSGDDAADMRLATILRRIERRAPEAPDLLDPVSAALSGALDALESARQAIETAVRQSAFDPRDLERAEERLFALRALARKHDSTVDALPGLLDRFRADLGAIQTGEETLTKLETETLEAKSAFFEMAEKLSASRVKAALQLDKAVNGELKPLKLEAAKLTTHMERLDTPGPDGIDSVTFWVQTNPGSRPGPLMKVASGGELSRILLALKVSLADRGSAPTLVFDEIDTAVGGAVSDAIGMRLSRLSEAVQVMAITHAPQVAARGDHHYRISKTQGDDTTATDVSVLDSDARQEEIARMLAGATITEEARAAAARLMAHAV